MFVKAGAGKGVNSTDLHEYLTNPDENLQFSVWSDAGPLSVQNEHELVLSGMAGASRVYAVAVMACTRAHSTLCDQTLLLVNVSGPSSEAEAAGGALSLEAHAKHVSFAYHYGAYTIQQYTPGAATPSPAAAADYYYQNDDVYESNERFYFEFKSVEQRPSDELADAKSPYKLEFELVQCVYVQLNVTLANASLAKQVRQFTHGKPYVSLPRAQLKALFSLNRHNGVLSSLRVINAMLPGVYLFTMGLRLSNRSNATADADRAHFKLIVLPPAAAVAGNHTANFYKFKLNALGHVRLTPRLKTLDASQHKIRFKLIENKFSKRFVLHKIFTTIA